MSFGGNTVDAGDCRPPRLCFRRQIQKNRANGVMAALFALHSS